MSPNRPLSRIEILMLVFVIACLILAALGVLPFKVPTMPY